MLKFFKITLAIIFLCFIKIENVFAEEYDVKGYITSVKANNNGKTCFIQLSKIPNGPTFQAGYWYCNSFYAQKMFEVAKTAKVQQFPAIVTFNYKGYPEDSMWIMGIGAK